MLTLYGDFLYELTERIDKNSIDYDTIRREAHVVLNRIKNLLRGRVRERLLKKKN